MMGGIDEDTGFLADTEDDAPLSVRAASGVRPPQYWHRVEGLVEGGGKRFSQAMMMARQHIPSTIKADAVGPFNKNKYATLSKMLDVVQPILLRHRLMLTHGCGRIKNIGSTNESKKQLVLPVYQNIEHVPSKEYERVFMELPIVKMDAQGLGSLFTYGRRYLMQGYFSIAAGDDDGVSAVMRARIDSNPLDAAVHSLVEQINASKTIVDLKAWTEKNQQGFDILSEETLTQLRDAYTKRMEELKATDGEPKKNGKAKGDANVS